jgi:16S rRNA (adenine1518-N6/adenine1519-N6)-dimethyltransferase
MENNKTPAKPELERLITNVKAPAGFRARKTLGQNFLVDENVLRKLTQLINLKPEDAFVEIGPGLGALTKHIVPVGCDYTGIEIDERLVPLLREQFAAFSNCKILHQDFRKTDLTRLAAEKQRKLRVIGNIPYHLTSVIIFKAFSQRAALADMILTVQKEVAQRIVAQPGGKDYGILAVISQTFARTEILFNMSKHVFRPKPDVDSSVVRWQFQPPPLQINDEEFYIAMVKAIFGQRRKTLRRSLAGFLGKDDPPTVNAAILQQRPETLAITELIKLANVVLNNNLIRNQNKKSYPPNFSEVTEVHRKRIIFR